MQVIGDELVVAFELRVDQIERHNAALTLGGLADHIDGGDVPLVQRLIELLHFRIVDNLLQRPGTHLANDPLH